MRKTLITQIIAVMIIVSGLTGRVNAGEDKLDSNRGGEATSGAEMRISDRGEEVSRKEAEPEELKEARRSTEEARKVIVARVNGVDIDMFMLLRAMNRVAPEYVKEGEVATPEMTEKIKMKALDKLISEELAVQQAIKDGINPAPEAIEKVVGRIHENLGSEQAYQEYLYKSFITEEMLKKLIERSRRYELITAREVYGKVKVDDRVLRDEYEREKEKFVLPDNFVVEDVLFLPGNDEQATREKADEVLKTVKKKNNDVWKLLLDGTYIVRKIKITEAGYPQIHKTMTGMKEGDLSGVIKDRDGLHIIKVVKREPSRQASFEEARPSLEPKFLVPAQDQRKEEWEKELRKDAKIEIFIDESRKE